MRNLLVDYGSQETIEDKTRWVDRQNADVAEDDYVVAFHEDDRRLSPVGTAMERNVY